LDFGSKPFKRKKRRGGKKERTKSRMLNIEVVAGGLMKLTMQVNSPSASATYSSSASLCPSPSLAYLE